MTSFIRLIVTSLVVAVLALATGTGRADDRLGLEEITPETWRSIDLVLWNDDGTVTRASLVRPLWWIEETGATVGDTIVLHIPEMGVEGEAEILAIGETTVDSRSAPAGYQVVTGRFEHENAQVIDLIFESLEDEPVGTTPGHPFWSMDHGGWVEAGLLEPGEEVQTATGTAILRSINPRPGLHTVYNLEVHKTHTYYVSNLALWVHNACAGGGRLQSPKTIKFSHDKVSPTFSDGRKLQETIAMLRNEPSKAAEIPPVLTARLTELPPDIQRRLLGQGATESDLYAVVGNRRLLAARLAGSPVNARPATADELAGIDLDRVFSTESAGRGLPQIRESHH